MTSFANWTVALATTLLGAPALAAPVSYANPGVVNPVTYTFTATADGVVTAYFVGSTGSFGSSIGLSINGGAIANYGLQSPGSLLGASFNMGNVLAGDVLRFFLAVGEDGLGPVDEVDADYLLSSDASWNGGDNHIYSYTYGGDDDLPAGTYIGFEDLTPLASSDLNYDDHAYVFTNVTPSAVPLPAAAWLLVSGLAGFGFVARRRTAA